MTNIIMFIDINFNYIIYKIDGNLIKNNEDNDIYNDLDLIDTIVGYNIDNLMIEYYKLNNININNKLNIKKKVCLREMGKTFLNYVYYPTLKDIYLFIFGKYDKKIDELTMCYNCYFEIIYNNYMRK